MFTRNFGRVLLLGLIGLVMLNQAAFPQVDKPEEKPLKRHGRGLFLHPARSTPEDQLTFAERLQRQGRRSARRQFQALVSYWPDSSEAPTAQFHIAEIFEKRGNLLKAFDEYQYLMDWYAGRFPQYREVLERQFAIALRLMNDKKGKFLFLPGFAAPERSIPLFEKIVKNGPSWEKAPEAQYLAARANEMIDEYELAIVGYMNVQSRYPDSPFAEQSGFRRAYCLYLMSQESPNSEEILEQAWAAMTLFLNNYPASEHATVAQEYRKTIFRSLARQQYDKARFYDKVARNPRAALLAYSSFLKTYPNSEWTGVAELRIQALKDIAAANPPAVAAPANGEETRPDTEPGTGYEE